MRISNPNIARLLAFKGVRHLLDTVGFVHLDAGDPVFQLMQSTSLDPLREAIQILNESAPPASSSSPSSSDGPSVGSTRVLAAGAMPAAASSAGASRPPPSDAPASRRVDLWACPACTLENEGGATCQVCYENRPGMWPCPACRMINVPSRDVCKEQGCAGRRPGSIPQAAAPAPQVHEYQQNYAETAGAAASAAPEGQAHALLPPVERGRDE